MAVGSLIFVLRLLQLQVLEAAATKLIFGTILAAHVMSGNQSSEAWPVLVACAGPFVAAAVRLPHNLWVSLRLADLRKQRNRDVRRQVARYLWRWDNTAELVAIAFFALWYSSCLCLSGWPPMRDGLQDWCGGEDAGGCAMWTTLCAAMGAIDATLLSAGIAVRWCATRGRLRVARSASGAEGFDGEGMDPDWVLPDIPEFTVGENSCEDGEVLQPSTCLVCLDDYSTGDSVARLPCGHHFHADCVHSWLERSDRCPLRCEICVYVGPDEDELSVQSGPAEIVEAPAETGLEAGSEGSAEPGAAAALQIGPGAPA